jgi:hypothetical protein
VGRRNWKAKFERLAQTLEDKADTARWFPWSVTGWTISILIRVFTRACYGPAED